MRNELPFFAGAVETEMRGQLSGVSSQSIFHVVEAAGNWSDESQRSAIRGYLARGGTINVNACWWAAG
jgi:hypothetical protein